MNLLSVPQSVTSGFLSSQRQAFRFGDRLGRALVFLLLGLALPIALAGCGPEADAGSDQDTGGLPLIDDDTAGADDDVADDSADDDTAADDDDTAPQLESVDLSPGTRAIPAGMSKAFTATAHYSDGSSSTDEAFVFSPSDENVMTVDSDGAATGVENGHATLTVEFGGLQATAEVLVGPDVFYYDGVGGTLGAYDRASGAVTDDYLAVRDAVAAVPLGIAIRDGKAYIVEGGDFAPGVTGTEGLVKVDLYTKEVWDLTVEDIDNPNAILIRDGKAYFASNLTDELIVMDLAAETAERYALPEGCSPNETAVVGEKVYVACTGYSYDTLTYADPGIVAVLDFSKEQMTTIETSQINPGFLALTPDGGSLYVVCTGNYNTEMGAIDEIDLSTDTVADSVDMTTAPGHIEINADGKAFIADNFSGSVFVLNTDGNAWLRGSGDPIAIPGAFYILALGISPFDGAVYAADWTGQKTAIIDPDDYSITATPATQNAGGYAFWE